jgi:hypothetical protein
MAMSQKTFQVTTSGIGSQHEASSITT